MGGRAVPLFPEQNGPNRQGGAHPLSGCRQHFDIVSGGAPPQLGGFFAVGAGAIVSAPAPSRWWHKSLGPGVARWGHFFILRTRVGAGRREGVAPYARDGPSRHQGMATPCRAGKAQDTRFVITARAAP